jgi:hypothetical protein
LNTYKQHFDLANERFQAAEDLLKKEKYHTAAHLFVNSAINYHTALCQKFLNKIPSHKPHSDTTYFKELSRFLGDDFQKYCDAYEFLIANKSQTDYGIYFSATTAKQVERRAGKIKEIAEIHQ